jgi:signal transduction histidine kinase
LEIRYVGLSLAAPERVQYRYQLEGEDEHWVEAGTRRFAHYGGLRPGHHRFRVTACNSDGVWSQACAVVSLTIRPYFYETWWFRGLLGAGLIGAVFGVTRHRYKLKLQRRAGEMERRHAIAEERARIAKDIHDDLGSSLTLIAVMGDLARQHQDAARIEKMSDTARQAIKSLDEIVWAVNPRNDTLTQLIEYLCGFAGDYLSAAQIRCRLDTPDQPPPCELSSKVRHHIFLAVKEALQNVVKHARAKEVWLRIGLTPDRLKIVIRDDGCGFAAAPEDALADGLRNMRQRMGELGGHCEVQSQPGSGTEITLEYPFDPPAGAHMFI